MPFGEIGSAIFEEVEQGCSGPFVERGRLLTICIKCYNFDQNHPSGDVLSSQLK